jgi:hypothetical protein
MQTRRTLPLGQKGAVKAMDQSLETIIWRAFMLASILVNLMAVYPVAASGVQQKYKHQAKIKATYDATTDKTTLAMWPYEVRRNYDYEYESIAIAAGITFSGKTLNSTPQLVEFGILSQSRWGWLFNKDRSLVAVIDGERLSLGEMKVVTARTFTIGATYFREDLNLMLPYEVYMKMANAKKVILKAGQVMMELGKEHLEALRDLGSQITR